MIPIPKPKAIIDYEAKMRREAERKEFAKLLMLYRGLDPIDAVETADKLLRISEDFDNRNKTL